MEQADERRRGVEQRTWGRGFSLEQQKRAKIIEWLRIDGGIYLWMKGLLLQQIHVDHLLFAQDLEENGNLGKVLWVVKVILQESKKIQSSAMVVVSVHHDEIQF